MKKLLVAMFGMFVIAGTLMAEGNVNEVSTSPQQCKFNAKLQKQMATAQKMSARYEKKAAALKEEGSDELAAAYAECGQCKAKITDSIKAFQVASDKACEIAKANPELSSLVNSDIVYYQKGERLTSRIKKLHACAAKYSDNPEFVKELNTMAESLQNYYAAKKAFKEANAKVKSFK